MLCKNCNYILTGKENFCPNCATPLQVKADDVKSKRDEPVLRADREEKIIRQEYVFPESKESKSTVQRDVRIFSDFDEHEPEPAPKNRYGARILLLLFLTCVFAAGAFFVADYFDITPSVFSLVDGTTEENTTAKEAVYNRESSILSPDVTYTPITAYVVSGKGLTLRKGPDKSYAPVTTVGDLAQVQIYGGSLLNEEWVYVYCAQKEAYGWLDAAFLAEREQSTATAEESIELPEITDNIAE